MVERVNIETDKLAQPVGPYALGVKVKGGTLLFISGCVAFDRDGNIVGQGDIGAQCRQALANMKAVLEAAGATFANVVKITNYVTNAQDYPKMAPVRAEYLREPYPASTLVEVRSLLYPELLVEIEAIAVVEE
ncbi:MAG: RidA family protein [Dehalococcoidia bacterium]